MPPAHTPNFPQPVLEFKYELAIFSLRLFVPPLTTLHLHKSDRTLFLDALKLEWPVLITMNYLRACVRLSASAVPEYSGLL